MGQNMPDQELYFFSLSMECVPFQIGYVSLGTAYSRTVGSQWRLSSSPYQRCEVIHPFQRAISLQIPVDNVFPRQDGTWCSQQHSRSIHSESQGNGCLPGLPHLTSVWRLRRHPYPGICGNRPYWFSLQMYESLRSFFSPSCQGGFTC